MGPINEHHALPGRVTFYGENSEKANADSPILSIELFSDLSSRTFREVLKQHWTEKTNSIRGAILLDCDAKIYKAIKLNRMIARQMRDFHSSFQNKQIILEIVLTLFEGFRFKFRLSYFCIELTSVLIKAKPLVSNKIF